MHLLVDLVLIIVASTFTVALVRRFGQPSLLGFLLAGLLIGPVGLELVSDHHAIEVMAEVGVVLLMFTIGLEISLKDLARMAARVFGGGVLQLVVTIGLMAGALWGLGQSFDQAVLIGLLVATSSTALVLRLLGDRGELTRGYGQLALAILLLQDIAVVVLMLVLPMFAGTGTDWSVLALGLLKAAGFAAGIFLVAWFLFPALLRWLVALRSREVFLLATLATVFGTALLAGEAGLSLALGAFIAGLVVSESEFSHPMFAEVLPFRDIFNGLFFVSVGLLVERDVLGEHLGEVIELTLLVLVGKALVVWGVGRLFRLDWRAALLAGVALCQVGEFGLVLTQQATGLGLITPTQRSVLITTAVITIGLTPLLLAGFTRWLATPRTELALPEFPATEAPLTDHVIIVGFGINGRNVSNALRELGVRFIVVEMNPLTVAEEGKRGVPIVLGDATRPALLDHLEVRAARTLISAVADATATREIVAAARHANPDLHIIARTRYVREIEPLRELGANDVVPEEFETSIELVGRVLRAYGMAGPTIEREKKHLRRAQYRALLGLEEETPITIEELLAEIEVEHLRLEGDDAAVGRTLRQLDLRARTGATAVAVIRGETAMANPDADQELAIHDELVLVGECQTLRKAREVLRGGAMVASA